LQTFLGNNSLNSNLLSASKEEISIEYAFELKINTKNIVRNIENMFLIKFF